MGEESQARAALIRSANNALVTMAGFYGEALSQALAAQEQAEAHGERGLAGFEQATRGIVESVKKTNEANEALHKTNERLTLALTAVSGHLERLTRHRLIGSEELAEMVVEVQHMRTIVGRALRGEQIADVEVKP